MPVPLVILDTILHLAWPDIAWFRFQSYKDGLGFVSVSLCTNLPFPRCLFSNIMLLPLYKSLPYCGVRSCRVASVVVNSDGSGSYAAVNRRLNKE